MGAGAQPALWHPARAGSFSYVNPAIAASALCAMVEGFGRHWYGRGEQDASPHDDATAVATLSTIWARGLGLGLPMRDTDHEEQQR